MRSAKNGWEENVRKVTPYTPGEQPDRPHMIKLNTNENPYPPAPAVKEAMKSFPMDILRLYPDPAVGRLTCALADYYGLKPENVFVGVGSDDVLATAFLTFFNSKKPILFPDITYSFYDVWANLYQIPYKLQPLDEDFAIVKEDYLQENGGIIFPNPNAPTGVIQKIEFIEDIVKANRNVVVIIDEAYIDFGGESCLPLIEKYENLLVVQTFSKSRSLAGLRIGFAMGHEKLISYLNDVKYSINSYTMNQPSIVLGVESIKEDAYFKETIEKVIATRERSKKKLKELGFSFQDSYSNFIFATHESCPAKELFEALKKQDIYVRYFNKERISDYLRISIGTDEEMDRLFEALSCILKH
ncbi:MAG: histidinol-phosphate transaminase [Lachnospiraceae bacterium]|nr:histidinol-phosphate transaminase [Lachnospiraceae bacterium]